MTTKWSAFASGAVIVGTDVVVGLQGGANVQWTWTQAATFMWASPSFTTPALGVATATSLAIGGATIGTNALAVTGTTSLNGGTVTTSAPILTTLQTWNSGAVTFVGGSTDITSTASAALSRVQRWQVGGSEVAGVIKDGNLFGSGLWLTAAGSFNGTAVGPGIDFSSNNVSFYNGSGAGAEFRIASSAAPGIIVKSTSYVGFASTATAGGTLDAGISRNAAGVTQFGTTAANASGAWLAAKGTLTGGTLADQANVLAITATQPASPTGTQNAILATITGAGSASQANYAHKLLYSAGYTGTSFNAALNVVNTNAGSLSSGLFVGLADTTPSVGAALIVDNGATTQPIFLARDNGSTVFTIADGGTVTATQLRMANSSGGFIYIPANAASGGGYNLNGNTVFGSIFYGGSGDAWSLGSTASLGGTSPAISLTWTPTSVSIPVTADSTTTTSGALQVAGGMAVRKRVFIDGITASAGLQQAVLCQSSGGEMIADSVACLASSERFKKLLGMVEAGAIDKIIRLPIHRWKYNEEGIFKSDEWTRERIGPTAEEVEAVDSRLVGYDKEGKARNISQEQLLALAIQAIQEQQVQIEELKARAA